MIGLGPRPLAMVDRGTEHLTAVVLVLALGGRTTVVVVLRIDRAAAYRFRRHKIGSDPQVFERESRLLALTRGATVFPQEIKATKVFRDEVGDDEVHVLEVIGHLAHVT